MDILEKTVLLFALQNVMELAVVKHVTVRILYATIYMDVLSKEVSMRFICIICYRSLI